MVSAKASGFLSQQETGDTAARQLCLASLYTALDPVIPGKLKASDPLPVHLRVSLQSLVSGNVRPFAFGSQSKGICEEGPSGPVKWPLSSSLWKSIA